VSTINGDANVPFYKELGNQGIAAKDIPVVAFSVGEEELAGIDTKPLLGHLAAWNYFESIKSPANAEFTAKWKAYTKNPKRVSNDPMEAHVIGFAMWVEAVKKAGTTDPDKVMAELKKARINDMFAKNGRIREDGRAELAEVRRIVQEHAAGAVLDLVLDAADPRGDHRPALPHRLRHGQPEPLGEALLHHHAGVSLECVDGDGVLLGVVERERRQVYAPPRGLGQRLTRRDRLAQHALALGRKTLKPRTALHQHHAEHFLELLDAGRHGRLGHATGFRSPSEMPLLGQRQQKFKLVEHEPLLARQQSRQKLGPAA